MPDLICHPETPSEAVRRLRVDLEEISAGQVKLTYTLEGEIDQLALPVDAPEVHTDGLWQHTCFEAFVREKDGTAYHEYNFSPSGAWAAYSFTGYREGMTPLVIAPPKTVIKYSTTQLQLSTIISILPGATLALSAVVEDVDREKSYWALKHVSDRPDFHHQDGFIFRLPVTW